MRHKIISVIKFSQLFAPSNEKIPMLMTLQVSYFTPYELTTLTVSSPLYFRIHRMYVRVYVYTYVCWCKYVYARYRSATFTCEKCETVESVCWVSISSLIMLVYQYVGWLLHWENHLIKYLQEGVTVVDIAFEMALHGSYS